MIALYQLHGPGHFSHAIHAVGSTLRLLIPLKVATT
jgi:hypothetical protein